MNCVRAGVEPIGRRVQSGGMHDHRADHERLVGGNRVVDGVFIMREGGRKVAAIVEVHAAADAEARLDFRIQRGGAADLHGRRALGDRAVDGNRIFEALVPRPQVQVLGINLPARTAGGRAADGADVARLGAGIGGILRLTQRNLLRCRQLVRHGELIRCPACRRERHDCHSGR